MRPDTAVPKRRGGNVRNARTTHPRRTARRERAAERATRPKVGGPGLSCADVRRLIEARDAA